MYLESLGKLALGSRLKALSDHLYGAVDQVYQARGARIEEQIAVMRALWAEPLVTFRGRWHQFDAVGINPLPVQRPIPIWIGGEAGPVLRRTAAVADGYQVDYIVSNAGVDERGIPGVRIASVEGLLIETDQYGRYHLEGIPGGNDRGRNFILKVDPATLPPGSVFTSENPRVRRITAGVPTRFDFGVTLPAGDVEGGQPGERGADGGAGQRREGRGVAHAVLDRRSVNQNRARIAS